MGWLTIIIYINTTRIKAIWEESHTKKQQEKIGSHGESFRVLDNFFPGG